MNLDPQSQDGARNRTLIKVVVGLAAAGVVIGLLTGLAGANALRAIGLDTEDPPPPTSAPTTAVTPSPEPPETTEPRSTPETTASDDDADEDIKKHEAENEKEPSLDAYPSQASPGEQINLSGSFPELGDGAVLQVQRLEDGSWDDFPVVAKTNGDGSFETWVVTSRIGQMKFRLKAQYGNEKTPPATVRIG